MAKRQVKSTQEAIALSGEALWAELEKIGFYGANLRAQVVNAAEPWKFVAELVSGVQGTNAALAEQLGEDVPSVPPQPGEGNWAELLEIAQAAQSDNIELRRRVRELKNADSITG